MRKHDPALDALLDLDGLTFVVDPEGGHWVRFVVNRVPATPEKPHGLDSRSRCTGEMASDWLVSIMPILLVGKSVVGRRIIGTGFAPCALTSTAMLRHCLPIFG